MRGKKGRRLKKVSKYKMMKPRGGKKLKKEKKGKASTYFPFNCESFFFSAAVLRLNSLHAGLTRASFLFRTHDA